MATIETRAALDGKKKFRVKVRLHGYPVQTATFDRLTDARKWIQLTESSIIEGRHFKTSEAKRHTLAQLVDRYIKDILPKKIKSAPFQQKQLLWWKSEIGSYTLSDVTPALLAECRDTLLRGQTHYKRNRSPSTVNRYMAALSHSFTIAMKEWGWVDDNPFRKVSKNKEARGRVRFLSDDERVRLLQVCKESKSPYLYTIVVLALSTGARKMELLTLKWTQVDFQRQVLLLEETKNGERRVLPMVGHAFELMKKLFDNHLRESPLVFPGQKPQNPIEIKRAWESALKLAEIHNFRFHDLRHSAASYLAMNGASLAEIAEVLGHKTLQMVKRYAHLSEAHTTRIVASMNAKIFG